MTGPTDRPTPAPTPPATRPGTTGARWTPPPGVDPDTLPPTVLILGGFLTSPPLYRRMRARLLALGAADVVIARVWTPDWLIAPAIGLGAIVGRGARAVAVARGIAARNASRGAPLLVIGHSAGGVIARLLTAEEPFQGRRHGLADAFGAIVTLGSPHVVRPEEFAGRRIGGAAAHFANRAVPGAAFAPRTAYVSVASRLVVGRPDGTGRERVAWRSYQGLLHDPTVREIDGDGVVPVASSLLDGARHVILADVLHGQGGGSPWYGADEGLAQWWPIALDAWHGALRARAAPVPAP